MAEFDVKGLEELRAAVEELTADLRKKVIVSALKAAARPIVSAARQMAPRRTGLVASRIRVATSKVFRGQNGVIGVYVNVRPEKGRRVKGTRVRVKVKQNDPYYWKFQELGTRKMKAHPFLRPAAEAHFPESIEIFKTALADRIEKANRRK